MSEDYRPVRAAADDHGTLRNFVLRRVLSRLAASFTDAPKSLYEGLEITRERNRPLNVAGCSFEYTLIALDDYLREALVEISPSESLTSVFDELELAQLHVAFYGDDAAPKHVAVLHTYLDDYNECMDYIDRLLFIYNTTQNPFKRLEMLIVHLLTNNQLLCYSTSIPCSRRTFEAI